MEQHRPYLVLGLGDHVVLGESDFGMPGLTAVEAIGPFVEIQASGPLITVHDSIIDAGLGIGHHPHRYNERLFYIEEGELDHDDALNGITGHMDTGDVGQFTEGQRGMIHSEWNHGDVDTRAYILVYSTCAPRCGRPSVCGWLRGVDEGAGRCAFAAAREWRHPAVHGLADGARSRPRPRYGAGGRCPPERADRGCQDRRRRRLARSRNDAGGSPWRGSAHGSPPR